MAEREDLSEAGSRDEPADEAAPDAIAGEEREDLGEARERPVLVGVAGILLIDLGIVELLLAALVFVAYALSGVILWAPTAVPGVASIVLGARLRRGRNRVAGLLLSILTMVLAPVALEITLLGVGISLASGRGDRIGPSRRLVPPHQLDRLTERAGDIQLPRRVQ